MDFSRRRGIVVEAAGRAVERVSRVGRRLRAGDCRWVSYDAAGNAYFIGQPIDSAELGLSAVSITSFDRQTGVWRAPQILIEDIGTRGAFNDKISVTGDPTRPGATRTRRGSAAISPTVDANPRTPTFIRSRTAAADDLAHDRRRTHRASPSRFASRTVYFQGNQIAVLPDGTLLKSPPCCSRFR